MKPVIVLVAPNGARKTKKDLPQIPITPDELADEALRCAEAGATIFHLHVRDDRQGHSLDPVRYQKALDAIRKKVGDRMMLQVSTETVGIYRPEDQIRTVKALKPEAVSIGVKELIPDEDHKKPAKEFLAWAIAQKINIQYICYSDDDVRYFSSLVNEGVIPKQAVYFLLFVLGNKHTGRPGSPDDLPAFLAALDQPAHWAICVFGARELDCCIEAVRLGGHVRIGFENNHLLANGTIAKTNAELIAQFTKGRVIATIAQTRRILPGN